MTRIAVAAASGQLGSAIVKATIEVVGKDHLIGLARSPGKAESLGIEIRPGDMGNVIAGIYEGIRNGAANNESHFAIAAGRNHQSWEDYFDGLGASA